LVSLCRFRAPLHLALAGATPPPHWARIPAGRPEAASYTEKKWLAGQKYMVTAANPLAVEAGYQILRQRWDRDQATRCRWCL
jgi:gamma-glutamyltranspeptidase/glutathione hydrolase